MESLAAIKEHVNTLREQNDLLKKHNKLLVKKIDDLEQYGRRTSLRFFNVPTKVKETAEDVREKVISFIKVAKIKIDDRDIDRAHRIGKIIEKEVNGKTVKVQPIIAKFTTFRARTRVYRQRKSIPNARTSMDLTKSRLTVLTNARERVKDIRDTFVYSDINCDLRYFINGSHLQFTSLEELEVLLQQN